MHRLGPILAAAGLFAVAAQIALGHLPPILLGPAVAIAAWGALLAVWRSIEGAGARRAAMAACIALTASLANLRPTNNGDTESIREQPWAVLRLGTLLVDRLPVSLREPDTYWSVKLAGGRRASKYPPGMALLSAPLYLPAALAAHPTSEVLAAFGKMAAALLGAATVLLLGLALHAAGCSAACVLWTCLLYGLGSSALSLDSQELWQHTGASFSLALCLWALHAPNARAGAAVLLLGAAMLVLVRPPDGVMVLPLLWAARERRTLLGAGLLGLAAGAIAFASYNAAVFGSPLTNGYLLTERASGFTTHEWKEAAVGLLVSPAHGLLFFVPWAPFALVGWRAGPTARGAILSAAALYALICFWSGWWGANAYGPRMLAEAQLPLAFAFGMGAAGLSRRSRAAVAGLGVAAVAIHAAFPFALAFSPTYSPAGAWLWAANPLGHLLGW